MTPLDIAAIRRMLDTMNPAAVGQIRPLCARVEALEAEVADLRASGEAYEYPDTLESALQYIGIRSVELGKRAQRIRELEAAITQALASLSKDRLDFGDYQDAVETLRSALGVESGP